MITLDGRLEVSLSRSAQTAASFWGRVGKVSVLWPCEYAKNNHLNVQSTKCSTPKSDFPRKKSNFLVVLKVKSRVWGCFFYQGTFFFFFLNR